MGLYAVLSGGLRDFAPGDEIDVRISRMDADEGRIFVTTVRSRAGQLALTGWSE